MRVAQGVLLLDVAETRLGVVGELVSITPESFEVWPTGI